MSTGELARAGTDGAEPFRCPGCHGGLRAFGEGMRCLGCDARYPLRDGVLVIKDQPTDDNRIAADFYDGPLWPKFRAWESIFWFFHGGERRSREAILRHLPKVESLNLLDVAIGDGAYLKWLPAQWSVTGVDVSKSQLASCRSRNPGSAHRLALSEAEDLPFHDGRFDAVLSIGGFNHFNDPEQALREMARVAKPGAPVVVSDEMPDLTDWMPGHKIGWPGLDRWVVSKIMNLGDDFTDLVERRRHIDVRAMGERVLEGSHYETIWRGSGYLLVGHAPAAQP